MPGMHFKQPWFTYSASGPCTKNKERIKKIKGTGDSRFIYHNELDKVCFQHNMGYGDFKDLTRRTAVDKVLHDKAFSTAKNPKYGRYECGLPSMGYKFFDKKTSSGTVKNEIISNNQLSEELHKPVTKYTHLS